MYDPKGRVMRAGRGGRSDMADTVSPVSAVTHSLRVSAVAHSVRAAACRTDRTPCLLDGERWFVVYTQPHREARAHAHLLAQGFRPFLPRYRKTTRHARKLHTVTAPLFPRYPFVAPDLRRDAWRSINGTFGVVRLIARDEVPLPMAQGIVESLVEACGTDGQMNLGRTLAAGDRVRVLSGPFAGLVGEMIRGDGAARVRILLRVLGGEIPVLIGREALVRAVAA